MNFKNINKTFYKILITNKPPSNKDKNDHMCKRYRLHQSRDGQPSAHHGLFYGPHNSS